MWLLQWVSLTGVLDIIGRHLVFNLNKLIS